MTPSKPDFPEVDARLPASDSASEASTRSLEVMNGSMIGRHDEVAVAAMNHKTAKRQGQSPDGEQRTLKRLRKVDAGAAPADVFDIPTRNSLEDSSASGQYGMVEGDLTPEAEDDLDAGIRTPTPEPEAEDDEAEDDEEGIEWRNNDKICCECDDGGEYPCISHTSSTLCFHLANCTARSFPCP